MPVPFLAAAALGAAAVGAGSIGLSFTRYNDYKARGGTIASFSEWYEAGQPLMDEQVTESARAITGRLFEITGVTNINEYMALPAETRLAAMEQFNLERGGAEGTTDVTGAVRSEIQQIGDFFVAVTFDKEGNMLPFTALDIIDRVPGITPTQARQFELEEARMAQQQEFNLAQQEFQASQVALQRRQIEAQLAADPGRFIEASLFSTGRLPPTPPSVAQFSPLGVGQTIQPTSFKIPSGQAFGRLPATGRAELGGFAQFADQPGLPQNLLEISEAVRQRLPVARRGTQFAPVAQR